MFIANCANPGPSMGGVENIKPLYYGMIDMFLFPKFLSSSRKHIFWLESSEIDKEAPRLARGRQIARPMLDVAPLIAMTLPLSGDALDISKLLKSRRTYRVRITRINC